MRRAGLFCILVVGLSFCLPVMAKSAKSESPAESASEGFPFIYLGAGDVFQRKWMTLWIWFEGELTGQERDRTIGTAPLPFSVVGGTGSEFFGEKTDELLRLNSDDFLQDYIRIAYNPDFRKRLKSEGYWAVHKLITKLFENGKHERYATDEEWKAFNQAVDRWLIKVDGAHPIVFAVKGGYYEWGDPPAWHSWSIKVFPDRVLPLLGDKLRRTGSDASAEEDPAHQELRYLVNSVLRYYLGFGAEEVPLEIRKELIEVLRLALGPEEADTGVDRDNREVLKELEAVTPPAVS
jgi:hypothetical protein